MSLSKDKEILLVVLALIGFGLVQVFSSSFIFAMERYGDGYFFFKKQLLFALVGLTVLVSVAKMPLELLRRWGWLLAPLTVVMLVLTLVPGLGVKVGGAKRWLPGLLGVRIEPCEIFKIALPFLLATFLVPVSLGQERYSRARRAKAVGASDWRFGKWHWPLFALLLIAPLVTFLYQPDFGTLAMSTLVVATLVFVCGLPWRYILAAVVAVVPTFYLLVVNSPYRLARVLAFLDPWQDPQGRGFQGIQSMLTFSSGGVMGTGVGDSQGKLLFLPEAHTDFTLAVFSEEWGFIGFLVLLMGYGYLVWRGLQVSNRAPSKELRLIALGLTMTFAFAVFINMGVVMGILPTKGLTLPFLSYGGSSLVMSCALFGVLLNIQKASL